MPFRLPRSPPGEGQARQRDADEGLEDRRGLGHGGRLPEEAGPVAGAMQFKLAGSG